MDKPQKQDWSLKKITCKKSDPTDTGPDLFGLVRLEGIMHGGNNKKGFLKPFYQVQIDFSEN